VGMEQVPQLRVRRSGAGTDQPTARCLN
jgi:hypothetical protein